MRLLTNFVPALLLVLSPLANALVITTSIDGSDAIWLAGRTDIVIPAPSDPWPGGLVRHAGPTPEEIQETLPPEFSLVGGDVVRVLDPADGGISFFNGFGGTLYGPQGNGVPGSSNIGSFGGISGYIGTQGALVGVFLDDSIPNGAAPTTLDFSNDIGALGVDFASLMPELGQIFFIGDGITSGGDFQEFIAPVGATRVAFGITDGFAFNGPPGAFDDNDGAYRIRIGINENPVPSPATPLLIGLGLLVLQRLRRTS